MDHGCFVPHLTLESGVCKLAQYESLSCCCYSFEVIHASKEIVGPLGLIGCVNKLLCLVNDIVPIPGGSM